MDGSNSAPEYRNEDGMLNEYYHISTADAAAQTDASDEIIRPSDDSMCPDSTATAAFLAQGGFCAVDHSHHAMTPEFKWAPKPRIEIGLQTSQLRAALFHARKAMGSDDNAICAKMIQMLADLQIRADACNTG